LSPEGFQDETTAPASDPEAPTSTTSRLLEAKRRARKRLE
jgi:hypothetical protein